MSRRINIWGKPNRINESDRQRNPKQSNSTNNREEDKVQSDSFSRFKTMEELVAEQNAKMKARRREINESYQTTSNPTQPMVEEEESESEDEDEDAELTTSELLDQLRRGKRQTQPKHIPRSQRRGRFCLSVSVSEEDELVFRAAAAAADMTFSEWSRKAMYKYAKVKPPRRIKK